jgi:excinuclease ABC subunit A
VSGIERAEASLTGQYLGAKRVIERRPAARSLLSKAAGRIKISGARSHNLKNIQVEFPLGQWVVITGVSGSGKSTLIYDVLYNHYLRHRGRPVQDLGEAREILGFESVDEVALIDQSPIGRTPRSNPVTYVKAFDEIRRLFAATAEARRRGYGPGHFSFNVDGGRCPGCKGDGRIKVEMHFLADVYVPCEACRGLRYQSAVLEIEYRGKTLDRVLAMTVDEALEFFSEEPRIASKLMPLKNVGLGYLGLGQSATTLSGGEAQRLKLAFEMTERRGTRVLYLFDEPTTGLHYHDIHFLIEAFDALLAGGHSLVVIEHNMEIIRAADYVVDLGPEGGDGGGRVVYQGPLEGLKACRASHTGEYLKRYLARSAPAARPLS